jgi:hypothetical protein
VALKRLRYVGGCVDRNELGETSSQSFVNVVRTCLLFISPNAQTCVLKHFISTLTFFKYFCVILKVSQFCTY